MPVARDRADGAAASDFSSDVAAAESSSFSLFGMLARWNKDSDDALRVQEFQEQVRGSFAVFANRFPRNMSFFLVLCMSRFP